MERRPRFSNPLVHATSPYLKQHAHNPVYWYPWGREAIEHARRENKPILLSIGYSTCYWCHVMEREVFENPSIAAQMNEHFVNIKVDREEHPELDDIYMVARQVMTREGGWPNNVFLTPQLKPFHAGGTYAPDESQPNRPAFPRLLEWLHYAWTTQEDEVKAVADKIHAAMQPFLRYAAPEEPVKVDIASQSDRLFLTLKQYHDARAGGFFQAPKFPHEPYLSFLLAYYERTGDKQALDIVTRSLSKMAAGGLYDHVGCGFHRYAVDKEWYVPHFEKMLYTQAMLARVYTDAARITGNPWFADIAKSVLEFVRDPLTDANGGFYSALDAETDEVEGAYYAWSPQEIQKLLLPEEAQFFVDFYALADIPKFPGHKHAEGQVIIARKALDEAARERAMPYVQLSALCGHVMNKLLRMRNGRKTPGLDNKIITGWNGLMIDAFAHAGVVFNRPDYVSTGRKAADFLLEHAIDKDGRLCRTVTDGRAQIPATLEDYAFLVKGLLSLHRAQPDASLLEASVSLMQRADEIFYDPLAAGYFFTPFSEYLPLRIKSADDATLPSANAIMMQNLTALHALTGEEPYRERAAVLRDLFLSDGSRMLAELATMIQASFALEAKGAAHAPAVFENPEPQGTQDTDDNIRVSAALFPADAKPGETCELIVTLEIKDGWHVNAHRPAHPFLVPTQADVQGKNVQLVEVVYPEPLRTEGNLIYEGLVNITARLQLTGAAKRRSPLKLSLRFQPCTTDACQPVRDVILTI